MIPNWVSIIKLLIQESKIRGMKAMEDNWINLTGIMINIFERATRSFKFLGKNKLSKDDLSEESSGLIILFCFWVNFGLTKFYSNGNLAQKDVLCKEVQLKAKRYMIYRWK